MLSGLYIEDRAIKLGDAGDVESHDRYPIILGTGEDWR
jgi:hypothetical protein